MDTRFAVAKPDTESLVPVADALQIHLSANNKAPEDLGIVRGTGTLTRQVVKRLVIPTDLATLRSIADAQPAAPKARGRRHGDL